MNYITLIKTVIAAVKSIEALMPQSAGKDKLDAAMAIVEGVMGDVSAIAPALIATISAIVSSLTAAGVFTRKAGA